MLVFPKSAPNEYEVSRHWLTRIAAERVESGWEPSEAVVPFRVGDTLGYITPDGVLRHIEEIRFDAALSAERYANFGPIVQNLVLQDPEGRIVSSLGPSGYPVFVAGELFSLDGVGNTLSSWNASEGKRWTRTFPSLITSLAAENGLVAVGLLSGEIVFITSTGELQGQLRPGRSEVEAIYGLSLNAGLLGVVSGQSPQRFAVYQYRGDEWALFVDRELERGYMRPVYVEASPNAAFVETQAGMGAVFAPSWEYITLAMEGNLVAATTDVDGAAVAYLAQVADRHIVRIVDNSGAMILESEFAADSVWLGSYDGDIILGRDEYIVRLGVELR